MRTLELALIDGLLVAPPVQWLDAAPRAAPQRALLLQAITCTTTIPSWHQNAVRLADAIIAGWHLSLPKWQHMAGVAHVRGQA